MDISNTGKKWLVENDEKMIEMYKNKNDVFEIARELKRTPGGVISRLVRQGIVMQKEDTIGYDKFLEYMKTDEYKECIKYKETHYRGFKLWTEEDIEKLKSMHEQGVDLFEISEKLERTQSAIKRRMKLLGMTRCSADENRKMILQLDKDVKKLSSIVEKMVGMIEEIYEFEEK